MYWDNTMGYFNDTIDPCYVILGSDIVGNCNDTIRYFNALTDPCNTKLGNSAVIRWDCELTIG